MSTRTLEQDLDWALNRLGHFRSFVGLCTEPAKAAWVEKQIAYWSGKVAHYQLIIHSASVMALKGASS